MATERFIQFIWKYRLYSGESLRTTAGTDLEIMDPGEQNIHAGPDFFNARIRSEQIEWAGNVEVHRLASDWYRHGHHLDPGYNNVILHVVGEYDSDVTNSLGRRIHTMVPAYNPAVFRRYHLLQKNDSWLPCSKYITEIPPPKLSHCLGTLQAERVAQKSRRIEQILCNSSRSREEVLYMALGSGYGGPVNTVPFEMLAKGIPFHCLMERRDNLHDIEAMLFGYSGMLLPAKDMGPYPSTLWTRYNDLKDLLGEQPVPLHLWKFLRIRPHSFPTLRISQFASMIHHRFPLAGSILNAASLSEIEQLLRSGNSVYWDTHYLFGKSSPPLPKYTGDEFIDMLIINVIIPFLSALGKVEQGADAGIRASEIMAQLKVESNQIIKNWTQFGVVAHNVVESQALLQLYNIYCKQKRCLDCCIGAEIMELVIHKK